MVYARIWAFPTNSSTKRERYGGALVNCWIERDDIDEAVSVARRLIAEHGWFSESVEEARICVREEFPEDSLKYFDQALTDKEVVVFYTYPRDEGKA